MQSMYAVCQCASMQSNVLWESKLIVLCPSPSVVDEYAAEKLFDGINGTNLGGSAPDENNRVPLPTRCHYIIPFLSLG